MYNTIYVPQGFKCSDLIVPCKAISHRNLVQRVTSGANVFIPALDHRTQTQRVLNTYFPSVLVGLIIILILLLPPFGDFFPCGL